MFIVSGKTIQYDRAWTHPDTGVHYPANWLRLTTLAEKQAVGLVEVTQSAAQSYDQRFYWGYDQDGQLIPKDHSDLVTLWITTTRTTANTLLQPSDWMVVRQADNGTAMDQAWKDWREAVRLASNEKVLHINTTNDTDELAAYVTSSAYSTWPLEPGEVAEEFSDSPLT